MSLIIEETKEPLDVAIEGSTSAARPTTPFSAKLFQIFSLVIHPIPPAPPTPQESFAQQIETLCSKPGIISRALKIGGRIQRGVACQRFDGFCSTLGKSWQTSSEKYTGNSDRILETFLQGRWAQNIGTIQTPYYLTKEQITAILEDGAGLLHTSVSEKILGRVLELMNNRAE